MKSIGTGGRQGDRKLLPGTENIVTCIKEEQLIFQVPACAFLTYGRTFEANYSNLKLLRLPPLLVANDEAEDSVGE